MTRVCSLFIVCVVLGVRASLPEKKQEATNGDGYLLPEPRISRGFKIYRHDAWWHVGIFKKTPTTHKQICGGTVVSRSAVITAAHCFSYNGAVPAASNYAVAAGKLHRQWDDNHDQKGVQKSDIKDILIPPRYIGYTTNFQSDIAVVILAQEFNYTGYVGPALLSFNYTFDTEQLRDGNLCKVVGWGLTGENSLSSPLLQGATLPSISIHTCIEQSPPDFRKFITEDKICSGYNNGTAVCHGDSGGGLVSKTGDSYSQGNVYLHGVVSTSPVSEGNECNIYTWATFTHVLKHEHFLKSVIPDIVEEPTSQKPLI